MFAITPIVIAILALAGGGVSAIGSSHEQSVDGDVVAYETCVEASSIATDEQAQDADQQAQTECDPAYEPESQAALNQ